MSMPDLTIVANSQAGLWTILLQKYWCQVTVITETTWSSLDSAKPLQQSDVPLCSSDHTQLKVLGKIPLYFVHYGASYIQPVHVAQNLKNNLLVILL